MRLIPTEIVRAFDTSQGFSLEQHCILLGEVGSRSHGTHVASANPDSIDDRDYMGVVVPPLNSALGLDQWEHWTWREGVFDVVLYSARKFFTLLLKGNPNVLGLLWLDEYVQIHPAARKLLEWRSIFSSKAAYPSFVGYAQDQLKKMTAFDSDRIRRYDELTTLLRSADIEPEAIVKADVRRRVALALDAAHALGDPYLATSLTETVHEFFHLHRRHFSGYMGEKRKRLVQQLGFDAKNASHLIRLLRMGIEFMESGVLQVRRADAAELLAIKQGQWSLERIQEEADRLFDKAEQVIETSPLAEEPDHARANQLLVKLHLDMYGLVQR